MASLCSVGLWSQGIRSGRISSSSEGHQNVDGHQKRVVGEILKMELLHAKKTNPGLVNV